MEQAEKGEEEGEGPLFAVENAPRKSSPSLVHCVYLQSETMMHHPNMPGGRR